MSTRFVTCALAGLLGTAALHAQATGDLSPVPSPPAGLALAVPSALEGTAALADWSRLAARRAPTTGGPGILRVDAGAPGPTHDGASWSHAYASIAEAMAAARPGDELWVRSGTYTGSVILKPGVRLYGGFTGHETRRVERDWRAHRTILSGSPAKGTDGQPVVLIQGVSTRYPTMLDGFTIRGGSGYPTETGPVGGGVYIVGPVNALVAHNTITGNSVVGSRTHPNARGGGIGIGPAATARIKDNILAGNTAGDSGGAIATIGSIGSVDISNNTIVGNEAAQAGAIDLSDPRITLENNIVVDNTSGLRFAPAPDAPAEGEPRLISHVVHHNRDYNIQGFREDPLRSSGNMDRNPQFATGQDGYYRLDPWSPCVNAGTDAPVEPDDTDIFGESRIIGGRVDIGANEAPPRRLTRELDKAGNPVDRHMPPLPRNLSRVYVNRFMVLASDDNDGTSWKKPKRTIQAGIDAARQDGGEVWVTAGPYPDALFVPRGVRVRGGFEGKESSPSQRKEVLTQLTGYPRERTGLVMAGTDAMLERFDFWNSSGVDCGDASPLLVQCAFMNNLAPSVRAHGGSPAVLASHFQANIVAMQFTDGAPFVHNCAIVGNSGIDGPDDVEKAGGVILNGARALLSGNVFAGNTGGAVSADWSTVDLYNNTFHGNAGYPRYVFRNGEVGALAGAVESRHSALTMANNIIASNLGGVQDTFPVAGYPVIRNNCVFENGDFDWNLRVPQTAGAADTYRSIPDPTGTHGNIRTDPLLVGPRYGDFRIHQWSPCRNVGDDSVVLRGDCDFEGDARRLGSAVDIGADENQVHVYPRAPRIIHVSEKGSENAAGGTWRTAVNSVQAALDRLGVTAGIAAGKYPAPGGEVWVARGAYNKVATLPAFVSLYGGFRGNETDRSQRDPVANPTELNGRGAGTVLRLPAGSVGCVIDGFTIQGGRGPGEGWSSGGGIGCMYGTSAVISHNVFSANVGPRGHALGADHAWVNFTENTVTRNGNGEALSGAAVVLHHSVGLIAANAIEDNAATGLSVREHASATVRNNVIRGNHGPAGGIFDQDASGAIANNLITGNTAEAGGGGLSLDLSTEDIRDNVVTDNQSRKAGGGVLSLYGNPLLVNNTILRNTAREAGKAEPAASGPDTGDTGSEEETPRIGAGDGAPTVATPGTGESGAGGGGIYLHGAGMLLNNLVAYNSSGLKGEAISSGPGGSTLIAAGNCFFANTAFDLLDVPPILGTWGNFSDDPKLKREKDGMPLHLSAGSPCIDHGTLGYTLDTETDLDGNPRILGGGIDIGADEAIPTGQVMTTTQATPYYRPNRPNRPSRLRSQPRPTPTWRRDDSTR